MRKTHTFILLIALLFLFTLSFSSTFAASPTPSSSPSPSPTASTNDINAVTENLKKRLQATISGDDADLPLSSHRGLIGVIRDVIKDTIILDDKDGKKKVLVGDKTVLLRSPGNTAIKIDDVRIDDYIIAIGNPGADDELAGLRIIVSATPLTTSANHASSHLS